MIFTATEIPEVIIVDPVVHEDDRGFLMETWQAEKYVAAGIDARFVQDVHTGSTGGTLRGLHYQVERPQGKLVRALQGSVFDVAVDLRRSSPTFGRWVGETLSEQNRRLLWIPPGFAHGFLVLSDDAEIEYRLTDFYAPEHERTIRWDDPDIDIDWPIAGGTGPLVSAKDSGGVPLADADTYP
jgi:dTDP-4-dehydrorhamnose 3,5-epimerase